MLDFRVDTFLTVCRLMNYTRAAGELHITQPAVSQHISCLEAEYGVKLFRYEGRKLTLTDEGAELRDALQQMENDERSLKSRLEAIHSSPALLSFGVTMTIGEYAVTGPLKCYLKKHPDTNIHMRYGNTEHLLADLENGRIDFAIVEGYYPEGKYAAETFMEEDFIPVCSAKHIFPKIPHRLSDLFSERLIIREPGSGTRSLLERSLALQNFSVTDFSRFIELENMHAIRELLLADCGISFLYRIAVDDEIRRGNLCEIELVDFSMKHDFTFIWKKESIFSEKTREICLELRSFTC